ncbi:hypothetical protein CYMTET_52955 [Cymbomonas tetramitiformis]|uniref:Uncharacterized protein n=1 Tax=Cymbomonas tetramitiformis TaxID=36881 RepID=A0AAE0BJT2_9CHLO|nr:hypothetical protein CYMTET_52955 [Cymbomonas tetramitiformis]
MSCLPCCFRKMNFGDDGDEPSKNTITQKLQFGLTMLKLYMEKLGCQGSVKITTVAGDFEAFLQIALEQNTTDIEGRISQTVAEAESSGLQGIGQLKNAASDMHDRVKKSIIDTEKLASNASVTLGMKFPLTCNTASWIPGIDCGKYGFNLEVELTVTQANIEYVGEIKSFEVNPSYDTQLSVPHVDQDLT